MHAQKYKKDLSINNNELGFTLLEVLVAIVILSIGLLGMASLTIGIIQGNKLSNDLTTATTLAQDKMEEKRLEGYSGVTAETKGSCPSPYDDYEIEVVVTDDSPATGMKTVVVTSYWQDQDGDEHSVELKTILSQ